MLVALFIGALVLETLGVLASVKEYLDGRERWRRLSVPAPEATRRTGGRRRSGYAVATWSPPEPANVEERVASLEKRLDRSVSSLRTEIGRVTESVPKTAEKAAAKVEERLEADILKVIAYLTGYYEERSKWLPRWWIGPALLTAGVLVGFVGNLVGAFTGR